ncbi:MAG: hypothetical protein GXO88_01155 [Chlorobi bacterium]|nr:hypothetical protein [Chlorobiota bacterium]
MKGKPDGNWEILDNNKIINTSYIFPPTLFVDNQEIKKYFWGTADEPPKRHLIKTNYGDTLGWKPFEKYHFAF